MTTPFNEPIPNWQTQAATLLVDLLQRQADTPALPLLAWEVHNAGCLLIGTVTDADDRRAAWAAWADTLALIDRSERPAAHTLHLTARGRVDGVQVAIQTTVSAPLHR